MAADGTRRDGQSLRGLQLCEQCTCTMILDSSCKSHLSPQHVQAATDYLGRSWKSSEEYVEKHWRRLNIPEASQLGAEVFQNTRYDGDVNTPRYIIACGGTSMHQREDLIADARSRSEQQGNQRIRNRWAPIVKVITYVLDLGGRCEEIRLTGHSLGTEHALRIGMYLKKEYGIKIETLLFNPSNRTLASLLLEGDNPLAVRVKEPCRVFQTAGDSVEFVASLWSPNRKVDQPCRVLTTLQQDRQERLESELSLLWDKMISDSVWTTDRTPFV